MTTIGATAALLVASAAVAQASSLIARDGSIHGCAGNPGQLQIITPRTLCGRGERSITLGAPGKTGARCAALWNVWLFDRSATTCRSAADGKRRCLPIRSVCAGSFRCAPPHAIVGSLACREAKRPGGRRAAIHGQTTGLEGSLGGASCGAGFAIT